MKKESLCEIHSAEIEKLRDAKHDIANRVSTLQATYCEMQKDISEIKIAQSDMSKSVSSLTTDITWLKDAYKNMDTKFWAVIIMSLGTLIGTVINFLSK